MELTRRTVAVLTALLAVSLVGLVVLQIVLLDGARRQKDRAFAAAAHAALTRVADQLDQGEVRRHVAARFGGPDDALERFFRFPGDSSGAAPLHVIQIADTSRLWVCPDTITATVLRDSSAAGKSRLVRQILLDLSGQAHRPVTERLAAATLDSLLHAALADAGLPTAADYGVAPTNGGEFLLRSPDADPAVLAASPFRTRLFPTDFFAPANDLVVHFPGRAAWTWRQLAPLLAGSVILTALVIACAVVALRTIVAQRRFARELVTFVDNLTHEFKTPLATMALASEALARDDVRREPGTLERYTGMIGDEVGRLREHIDRILQLAHLERAPVALDRVPVDAHEVLAPVLDGFELQAAARGGRLQRDLAAPRAMVLADPVHLAGMVSNLLDNAVKYSPAAPEVSLDTASTDGRLAITVADRGCGIAPRDRQRVFERYFRCQRGDRHDVKGFGLGLSYVRLMAAAHGGAVTLDARPGGGTVATLVLPLAGEVDS